MAPDTARGLLAAARLRLEAAGTATPALDARLLFQAAAGIDHAALAGNPDLAVAGEAASRFDSFVGRRCTGEPVSRILGRREFYGREFAVAPPVLDPRPDTETVIDACLELLAGMAAPALLDLGTGSGAIAVTLLCEIPGARATGADISAAALDVAWLNANRLGAAERFAIHHGNWFDGIDGTFDLIVSNPPYIPSATIASLAAEVREHDPRISLDGGPDGLEAYRRIARHAEGHLRPGGIVVVEIGAGQVEDVTAIFAASGFRLNLSRRDLAGHVRALGFLAADGASRKGK
jgi:release factor glutamine methyltransferase